MFLFENLDIVRYIGGVGLEVTIESFITLTVFSLTRYYLQSAGHIVCITRLYCEASVRLFFILCMFIICYSIQAVPI